MEDNNNRYMLDLIDGAHGRTVKWMGRIIVALIVAWLVTIGAFLWYLSLYDYISEETTTTTEYSQDSNGINVIAEGTGVSVNGAKVQTDGNDADQSAEGENNGQPPQNDG